MTHWPFGANYTMQRYNEDTRTTYLTSTTKRIHDKRHAHRKHRQYRWNTTKRVDAWGPKRELLLNYTRRLILLTPEKNRFYSETTKAQNERYLQNYATTLLINMVWNNSLFDQRYNLCAQDFRTDLKKGSDFRRNGLMHYMGKRKTNHLSKIRRKFINLGIS